MWLPAAVGLDVVASGSRPGAVQYSSDSVDKNREKAQGLVRDWKERSRRFRAFGVQYRLRILLVDESMISTKLLKLRGAGSLGTTGGCFDDRFPLRPCHHLPTPPRASSQPCSTLLPENDPSGTNPPVTHPTRGQAIASCRFRSHIGIASLRLLLLMPLLRSIRFC